MILSARRKAFWEQRSAAAAAETEAPEFTRATALATLPSRLATPVVTFDDTPRSRQIAARRPTDTSYSAATSANMRPERIPLDGGVPWSVVQGCRWLDIGPPTYGANHTLTDRRLNCDLLGGSAGTGQCDDLLISASDSGRIGRRGSAEDLAPSAVNRLAGDAKSARCFLKRSAILVEPVASVGRAAHRCLPILRGLHTQRLACSAWWTDMAVSRSGTGLDGLMSRRTNLR